MALGADRRDVLWLVLRDALRLVLLGIALGIPTALAAARTVVSQLFGISAADPLTIRVSTRRATRVDPLVSLRYE